MGPAWCIPPSSPVLMAPGQPPGACTVWWPKLKGGKPAGGAANPGGSVPKLKGREARLKPRGVPAGMWVLLIGKWPLELASERDGAICAGSRT